jgi:hypothetical protein
MDFILQRGGYTCGLVALANAARYFGLSTPEPGDAEWDRLIVLAQCRYGSALDYETPAQVLGLRCSPERPFSEVENQVHIRAVWNPEPVGSALHAVLVTPESVVNYLWQRGPVELPRSVLERMRPLPVHLQTGRAVEPV